MADWRFEKEIVGCGHCAEEVVRLKDPSGNTVLRSDYAQGYGGADSFLVVEDDEFLSMLNSHDALVAENARLREACEAALTLLDKRREECNEALTVLPHPPYVEGPIAKQLRAALAEPNTKGEGRWKP